MMQQIADWLKKLGMSEYTDRFVENRIDLSVPSDLTDQDLKDLGVLLGDRRKLLRAIRDLGNASVAVTAASAPVETEPTRRDHAERRQLTVMFADLVGSTTLSTRLAPEDRRSVIGVFCKCVAETVARFDGFVAKYMGDGALIYFGYLQAHEDDAERAVRAGLALIDVVGKLRIQEPLQVPHRGRELTWVVVGDLVGSGRPRNVGSWARHQTSQRAFRGSPSRIRLSSFELQDLGPKDLKGIAGAAWAWVALRASSVESRFEALHTSGLTALVGREEETELPLRRLARAKTGEGQVVLIAGEPVSAKGYTGPAGGVAVLPPVTKSVLVIVRRDFGGFWRMHMRVLRSLLIMSVGRGLFVIVRVHMGMRVAVHGISVPMFVRMSVAVLVGVRTTVAHPVFSCLRDSPNIGSVRSVSTRRTAP